MSEENTETVTTATADDSGLKKKNSDLLAKLKKAQADLAALQEASESAQEEAERATGDLAALEKRLNDKYQKMIDAEKARADAAEADLRTIRVDNAISQALSKGNVVPDAVDALAALFKAQAVYEDGQATINGKAIDDAISLHLNSKAGAVFRRAADNTGAGAAGSEGTKAATFTREDILGAKSTEFAQLAASNPTEANAILDQVGLSQLKV
jgi:chromosome segregation ATPase